MGGLCFGPWGSLPPLLFLVEEPMISCDGWNHHPSADMSAETPTTFSDSPEKLRSGILRALLLTPVLRFYPVCTLIGSKKHVHHVHLLEEESFPVPTAAEYLERSWTKPVKNQTTERPLEQVKTIEGPEGTTAGGLGMRISAPLLLLHSVLCAASMQTPFLEWTWQIAARVFMQSLGPPGISALLSHFLGEGSLTKINYRKKLVPLF